MLPASCMARTLPRVAGTFTTSMPVAFVKGSNITFTFASPWAPRRGRLMPFPAALARRVHTKGAAAARLAPATPAVATNVRRDIVLGCVSVRSLMALPPAPGGCPARSTYRTGCVVGIVGGTSRSMPSFQVSSGAARVDPVLQALPVDDQRHHGQPPGVKRNGRDGHLGPAYLGGRGAERAIGEELAHEGGHGDPAAV